ncbi:hypothetical protein LTR66_015679, partial [Elasticomyces elasticus]
HAGEAHNSDRPIIEVDNEQPNTAETEIAALRLQDRHTHVANELVRTEDLLAGVALSGNTPGVVPIQSNIVLNNVNIGGSSTNHFGPTIHVHKPTTPPPPGLVGVRGPNPDFVSGEVYDRLWESFDEPSDRYAIVGLGGTG